VLCNCNASAVTTPALQDASNERTFRSAPDVLIAINVVVSVTYSLFKIKVRLPLLQPVTVQALSQLQLFDESCESETQRRLLLELAGKIATACSCFIVNARISVLTFLP
jgi:uncharacterized membrane protein